MKKIVTFFLLILFISTLWIIFMTSSVPLVRYDNEEFNRVRQEVVKYKLLGDKCETVKKLNLELSFWQRADEKLEFYIWLTDDNPDTNLGRRLIYKGKFLSSINIEGLNVCLPRLDASVALTFAFLNEAEKKLSPFGAMRGYPVFNGKKNLVTFIGYVDEKYHGNYKIEQE